MKLNRKGYMLVEIIIATVLAFSIAYYLLNLTYKFKNANEDIYQAYLYTNDKLLITKNIMSDLENGIVQNIKPSAPENPSEILFDLCFSDITCEKRKLLLTKTNENTVLEYGKVNDNDEFEYKDVSYYKKKFEPTLIINSLEFVNGNDNIAITIPIKSIYDDNDYSIKIYAEYLKGNFLKNIVEQPDAEPNDGYFKNDTYREKIINAYFVNYIEEDTDKIIASWDVSDKRDESVIAWLQNNETAGFYDLYIGSTEVIYARSLKFLFKDMTGLETVKFDNLNTSLTTTMRGMFGTNEEEGMALTNLDLSRFNTNNVVDMYGMFIRCSKLTSLNLESFDTSNVTNMQAMFQGCNSLTDITFGEKFDTSNVTTMRGMFYGCSNLIELDLSKFNTSNVTNMYTMFSNCSSLTSLDLSSFDTSKVKDMSFMFDGCSSLTELDLKNFNTSKVELMYAMFEQCQSLKKLTLKDEFNNNFNTSNVTTMAFMFYDCRSLTELELGDFNTSKVTDMSAMFAGCSSLTSLDLSNFDTSRVEYMGSYYKLTGDTSKIVPAMFYGCSKLSTTLTIKNKDAICTDIFDDAATVGAAKIIVNYTSETSTLVDNIIANKHSTSNIVKGSQV